MRQRCRHGDRRASTVACSCSCLFFFARGHAYACVAWPIWRFHEHTDERMIRWRADCESLVLPILPLHACSLARSVQGGSSFPREGEGTTRPVGAACPVGYSFGLVFDWQRSQRFAQTRADRGWRAPVPDPYHETLLHLSRVPDPYLETLPYLSFSPLLSPLSRSLASLSSSKTCRKPTLNRKK